MEKTTLPQLTQKELHILLAALDELPGKLSRVLHRKITDHVESVIREFKQEEEKVQDEVKRLKEASIKEAKVKEENDSLDRERQKAIMDKFDEMGKERERESQGARGL